MSMKASRINVSTRAVGVSTSIHTPVLRCSKLRAHVLTLRGVFSPNPPFLFLRTCQARPIRAHTYPGITQRLVTVRRAGRKRGARFESSEALAEQPAVARSAVELH